MTVHFRFHRTPKSIRPGGIELSNGTLAADLVVTCIGYTGEPFPQAEIAAGAAQGRPRVKLVEWRALLDIAQGD